MGLVRRRRGRALRALFTYLHRCGEDHHHNGFQISELSSVMMMFSVGVLSTCITRYEPD